MTQDEQRQFEQLSKQLSVSRHSADETRAYFLTSVGRLSSEARLYRGLFWCLLTFAVVATILNLLQS